VHQKFIAMGHSSYDLIPHLIAKENRWRATFIYFSPDSDSMSKEKIWLACEKRELLPFLRKLREAFPEGKVSQVPWIRSQN
jgi:hypothetical protein